MARQVSIITTACGSNVYGLPWNFWGFLARSESNVVKSVFSNLLVRITGICMSEGVKVRRVVRVRPLALVFMREE